MKHTLGPWLVSPYTTGIDEIIIEEKAGNNRICVVTGDAEGQEESQANARLIAAAPDLLEALKLIWSMFDDGRIVRNIANDHQRDWALKMLTFTRELQTIQRAIAKAEGVDPETAPVSADKTSAEAKS